MNRGWKRGINPVSSPRAAENFNSPSSSWQLRYLTKTLTVQAQSWDFWICGVQANSTVLLPPNPSIGDQVAVLMNNVANLVVGALPGQNIQGSTGVGAMPIVPTGATGYASVTVTYVGGGTWILTSAVGTEGGNGFATYGNLYARGTFRAAGIATLLAGINTSSAAAVTTPTLGAAAQLAQTTNDANLYITVTTAGTLTIAIGPTSGVANTIVAGLAAPLGAMYTLKLPAAWYIAVTSATTATWTTTAIVD